MSEVDDAGEHLCPRQRSVAQVLVDPRPDLRQRLAEFEEPGEFLLVGARPEIGMVAILLAALRIDARRLKVAVRILAEPGVGVGWWKPDRVQPVDRLAIGDPFALFVEIGPVPALSLARIARFVVAAMAQPLLCFRH